MIKYNFTAEQLRWLRRLFDIYEKFYVWRKTNFAHHQDSSVGNLTLLNTKSGADILYGRDLYCDLYKSHANLSAQSYKNMLN